MLMCHLSVATCVCEDQGGGGEGNGHVPLVPPVPKPVIFFRGAAYLSV